MDNYPSNSRKVVPSKADAAPAESKKEPLKPVVTGKVIRQKKSLSRRFKETFVGGDDKAGIGEYVVKDILVPAFQETVTNALTSSIEMFFYGESRGRRGTPRSQASSTYHTPYNRMSGPHDRRAEPRRDDPRRELSRQARATHDFDEVVLSSKVECEEVLDVLYENLSKFGAVSVADLYELVNITPSYTDNRWGWEDLQGTSITRIRNGYLLDLPRPSPLRD